MTMLVRRRVRWTQLVAIATVTVLSVSCASYQMGDPIRASKQGRDSETHPTQAQSPRPTATEYRNSSAQRQANEWELKWQQIQTPSDPVSWSDHFHVCGLKYRFRNYDQLFRCLDLLEAKIAAGDKRVPQAKTVQTSAPVYIDWLRASAYAELGEPEIALKWADSAWNALP